MELWQILLIAVGLIGAGAVLYLLVDLLIRAIIFAWIVKTIADMIFYPIFNPLGRF